MLDTNVNYVSKCSIIVISYTHILHNHILRKNGAIRKQNTLAKFVIKILPRNGASKVICYNIPVRLNTSKLKFKLKIMILFQFVEKFDYVCDQCGWKFLTKGNLKGHLETTHTDEKPFVCTKCDGR